jgi:hypothetical protein
MTRARLGTVAPASAATKVDRKQTKAIAKLDKRTKAAGKRINTVARRLGTLSGELTTTKDGLAAIQAAVPTVISSLTALGDAAKQLKAGLETAGAGLTTLSNSLKGSLAAAEYGVPQLYFDPEGDGFEADDAVPGQLLVSSDVPDDANQATVAGKLMLSVPDGTTAGPVALKAGIRSGEKDGNPIADRAPRSDATPNPLGFPDDKMIDLTDPATLLTLTGAPSRFTVTNTSGGPAAAIFDVTARFNDLSASATDVEE